MVLSIPSTRSFRNAILSERPCTQQHTQTKPHIDAASLCKITDGHKSAGGVGLVSLTVITISVGVNVLIGGLQGNYSDNLLILFGISHFPS